MTKRKFYKTVFTYEVISEEPIPDDLDMVDIAQQCLEGDYSGATVGQKETILNGKQAAKALAKQGSEPEFFRINADGGDIDDVANNTYGQ